VTAYAIWKWFDNMIDNKKEQERKDYFVQKSKIQLKEHIAMIKIEKNI
jgi:hypothetical protein